MIAMRLVVLQKTEKKRAASTTDLDHNKQGRVTLSSNNIR